MPTASSVPEGETAQGAAVVAAPGGDAESTTTMDALADQTWFVPSALDAVTDLPPVPEEQGCQVDQVSADPIRCEYGDPNGDITIAVVGDSKILQWQTVLSDIADEHGWRIVSYTKSACAFSSGMQLAKGEPYTSCADWNTNVAALVLDEQPDLVLTTNRVNKALEDATDVDSRSEESMVDAIAERWAELSEADIPVVSILDNPSPGISVYECVAENMDDLSACAFDRQTGVAASSAPGHQEAAERVPGTQLIDIRGSICPDTQCAPVIGNVLVYRQSSHITDTYAMTLKPVLEAELVPVVQKMAQ